MLTIEGTFQKLCWTVIGKLLGAIAVTYTWKLKEQGVFVRAASVGSDTVV